MKMPFMRVLLFCSTLTLPGFAAASMEHDPLLVTLMFDELEWTTESGSEGFAWDARLSVGKIHDQFLLETEGEKSGEGTQAFETRLLYSRPVFPYWNVNAGVRVDAQPGKSRQWLTLELEGLAPGFIETRLSAYVGENGRTAARAEAELNWYLSERWEFSPGLELNVAGRSDAANRIGSGLSSAEIAARFRYRLRPDLKPYLGVEWTRLTGATADFARQAGDEARELKILAGLHIWF